MSPLRSIVMRSLAVFVLCGFSLTACQCSPSKPADAGIEVDAGFDAGPPKPALTLLSITPSAGPLAGKNEVTLVGTGFEAGVSATIGGNALTDVLVKNETTLTGTVPTGIPGVAVVAVKRADETAQIVGAGYTYLCRIDDDCAVLNAGLRCQESTGQCIPAKGCSDDTNCNGQDPDDYCYLYGTQCRCVTEPNDGGFSGVCRRRRAACEPCTEDSQCGSGGVFDPPGACRALTSDPGAPKFCLRAQVGSCGCGMVVDSAGYCKPQSNDCSQMGCGSDSDCPGGQVCNTARCLCENRCRWDFLGKKLAPPGCPPNTVCWVDNANLDPNSLYYGSGRCRPPCENDEQCSSVAQNPKGGSNLVCKAETDENGSLTAKRCRAKGECMDDLECPVAPSEVNELGYCDRGTFACKSDCRTGVNPVTGQPYSDCRQGYRCEAVGSGQPNQCVLRSCSDMGGARIACRTGQYCCGEDKNDDGVADPCPPKAEREPNDCYDVPRPPFCTTCTSQEDCQNIAWPSWMGTCANGSKSPSCSPLPNVCIAAIGNTAFCGISTWDDPSPNDAGIRRDFLGCPSGYIARPIITRRNSDPNAEDYCQTNDDCRVGNTTGVCDPHPNVTNQDGRQLKVCVCNEQGETSSCPNDPDAGIKSVCKFGFSGISFCIDSLVCTPQPATLLADAGPPSYGCGFTE